MNERSELWKDSVDRKFVKNLAEKIDQVFPSFDKSGYVTTVLADRFFERELKDRLNTLARHLKQFLPPDYKKAISVLVKAAPLVSEFGNWALTCYVEQFGQHHFDLSVAALKELTKHGTSEFGIRPYVMAEPDQMLKQFSEWAIDDNHHVRRLAAEGSRPRGVWVAHIPQYKTDPTGVLKLLELLKADDSLYVRKAVANNLNDISKDNPKHVISAVRRWLKSDHPHTQWIVKHGCRTLIKKGEPEILELLGFDTKAKLKLASFKVSRKRVKIGDSIKISCTVKSESDHEQKLIIDYRIVYAKKNDRQSSKVFKLTKQTLPPRGEIRLETGHSFADLSTRKHHPGTHSASLLINGVESEPVLFDLARQ